MRAAGGGLTRMQAGENLPLLDKSDEELIALGFDPDTIRVTPRSRRRRFTR